MGGDIPGTYAPFSYPVLIVAIEGPAGYVILGIGDEDVIANPHLTESDLIEIPFSCHST